MQLPMHIVFQVKVTVEYVLGGYDDDNSVFRLRLMDNVYCERDAIERMIIMKLNILSLRHYLFYLSVRNDKKKI